MIIDHITKCLVWLDKFWPWGILQGLLIFWVLIVLTTGWAW